MLYFLHIPKTGGSALTTILDRHFKTSEILGPQGWPLVTPNQLVAINQYSLVRGHFGWGITKQMNHPEIITLLRNPIQNTISKWHHIWYDRNTNHWLPKNIALPRNLQEAVNHPIGKKLLSNPQTRYLALSLEVACGDYYEFLPDFLDPKISRRALLAAAKQHLKQCYLIGHQEQLDKFCIALCKKRGWEPQIPQQINVLPNRPNINKFSSTTINAIKAINALDQELYDFSKSLTNFRGKD